MNCLNCGYPLNVTQEEYDEWVESYGTCPRCDHPLGEPVWDEDSDDEIEHIGWADNQGTRR